MDLNSISKVLIVKLIDLNFFVTILSAIVLIFFYKKMDSVLKISLSIDYHTKSDLPLMVFANVTISCFYFFWNKQVWENNQVDTWLIVRTKYILTWICSNSKNRKMKYRSVGHLVKDPFGSTVWKNIYSLAILNTMVSHEKSWISSRNLY